MNSHFPQAPDLYAQTKLVIFDMDGTLYDAAKVRKRMRLELAKYYALRLHKFRELQILLTFRKERENWQNPAERESQNYNINYVQKNWDCQRQESNRS